MTELRQMFVSLQIKREIEHKKRSDLFLTEKHLFFNNLSPKIQNSLNLLKDFVGFETEIKTYFGLLQGFPENKESLLKLVNESKTQKNELVTEEVKFIVDLIEKNQEICEFEEKLLRAIENVQVEEINSLEILNNEKEYVLGEEVTGQLSAFKKGLADNPNYVQEKQIELKKNAKNPKIKRDKSQVNK